VTTTDYILAKKYATAYSNLTGDIDDRQACAQLRAFLKEFPLAAFVCAVPSLPLAVKWDALHAVLGQVQASQALIDLVHLIIKSGRGSLLKLVFEQIQALYNERHGIMTCTITSSHQLDKKSLAIIQSFLARQTGWDIIYDYAVDPTLIAGIRAQSATMMWEYSIRKQLHNVSLSLIR
jgi:F0F1-type ATP synthase delta subunit